MSEKETKIKEKNNKKVLLIVLIIIAALAFMTAAYAVISKVYEINQKTTTGTVIIEKINLKIEDRLTGEMKEQLTQWSPGDASLLTWNTVNIGTAAIKTRHTIQVYWNDSDIEETAQDLLYLYPANMTNAEVLTDYKNGKENAIEIDKETSITVDDVEKVGFSYSFYGDTLDGTDQKGQASEVNYDNGEFGTNTFTTTETNTQLDKIGFRILLSPDTSYLMQEETLSIKVLTEVLQNTQNGAEEWTLESVEELH